MHSSVKNNLMRSSPYIISCEVMASNGLSSRYSTQRTSIKNKTDLKFLAIAIVLEVAKGLLYPVVAEKMGYGDSFNPEDRLDHDDKSIKDAHKKANDEYRDKHQKKNPNGRWIEFLYQTVPYDIQAGTGKKMEVHVCTKMMYQKY